MLVKEKNIPSLTMQDYTWLFYGEPGCGKSTIGTQFPNVLHLICGENPSHIDSYQQTISSWKEFLDVCKALMDEDHEYKTLVIDNARDFIDKCESYTRKTIMKIDNPADGAYGKVDFLTEQEARRACIKLRELGFCLVFIAHEDLIDTTRESGSTIKKATPLLGKSARKFLLSFSNFVGRIRREIPPDGGTDKRMLTFNGTQLWEGKAHLPENLLGQFPKDFQINSGNEAIGYQKLSEAFQNFRSETPESTPKSKTK